MRKFVDETGSICIFPEGIMKHPDALVKFRSGAFHINRPIFPIVIRHNNIICDGFIDQFIYKLAGKKNIEVEVHVLGPFFPPFTHDDIENIRKQMGKIGKMVLSRVINRDIIDDKH